MSESQCDAAIGVLGGEQFGDGQDVSPEELPAVAVSAFGLRGIAVTPRVHCNHAVVVAQQLRNGAPRARTESIRVME